MAKVLLVAVIAATIAVLAFVIGDRLRPKSWCHAGDEVASTLALDLVKTYFTALVAFVFVLGWQQHNAAHDHTVSEAKGLVETYRAAESLPQPQRQRVQQLIRDYTDEVLTREWPLMENESRMSTASADTFETLRRTVVAIRTSDPAVSEARSKALSGIEKAAAARQDRGIDMERTVPQFMYIALCFGAGMVLLNPVLNGIRVTRRSIAMSGLLGIVVGVALLAIHDLERPYTGAIHVPQDAFQQAKADYHRIGTAPDYFGE
ncbi:DUF4239 domain-containing protein [Nocardia sp. CDC159]|uniref:DUF4239 domain-containing protein n=1 Tax=Nocardia pulmonis TaxID=2951408 RepID=A0A9X2E1X0_9NOCA|nr:MULTISPECIES: DUF4239 domain-containing protein [Nocardia]MCM6772070.1 DUF4239 domain-containing protein [Nocardia pulmonis]MCM6785272.1 DUF4239 domain-containing protein [Nocardia sp. CDC159]